MKKFICSFLIVSLIMVFILILLPLILLPFLIDLYSNTDTVLTTFLFLLPIINPLASVGFGVYSGFDIKNRWFIPIEFALISLISVSVYFEEFIIVVSAIYLAIGIIAMIATHFIKRAVNRSKNK